MLRKPCLYFLYRWYVGMHESTISTTRTHWDVINDFMLGKYFHKRLYGYYAQRPVCSVDFLVNLSDQKYFFKESSLYVYYLRVISLFLKFIFFHKCCKCYFTSCSCLMVLRLRLGCKKKLVVFR